MATGQRLWAVYELYGEIFDEFYDNYKKIPDEAFIDLRKWARWIFDTTPDWVQGTGNNPSQIFIFNGITQKFTNFNSGIDPSIDLNVIYVGEILEIRKPNREYHNNGAIQFSNLNDIKIFCISDISGNI